MDLIRLIREKLGVEGTNLALDRPRITFTFIKNLLLYILTSRFHPTKLKYYPLTLMLEINTGCNLFCERCEREITPKKYLNHATTMDLIKRVKPILPYVYSVYMVSGLGESFLNPNLWSICQELKKSGVRVGFFTNGVLLNSSNRKKIFDEGIDSVLISIDSLYKEKFEAIRKGAKFEQIISNVKELVKERKQRGGQQPMIGLSFTFQEDTVEEMPQFLVFARKLGIDFISYAGVIAHSPETVPLSTFWVGKEKVADIFKKTRENSNKFNVPIRLPKINIEEKRLCEDMWHNMYIFYNGDVCPCPHYRRDKTYYFCMNNGKVINKKIKTPGLVLGNIYKEPILKLWNNSRYRNLRKRMINNNMNPPCENCYFRYGIH